MFWRLLLLISAILLAPAHAQNLVAISIQAKFTPARTSGVAPLAVFFDATATTDTQDTQYPFHELDYSWNFGDSGAGNWTYGSGNASYPCGNGMSSSFTAGIDNGSGGSGNVLTVASVNVGSVGQEVPFSASGLTGNPVSIGQTGSPSTKGQAGTYTINGAAQFVATGTTFTDNEVTPTNTYCQVWNASKNVAYGPVAAHVFETPGPYSVCLTVTGSSGTAPAVCQTIMVSDPATVFSGTNTTCVAQGTLPVQGVDGCPSGAAVAQQANWATILSTYALTGQRVLLKHDDTFTDGVTSATIAQAGPGTVDMYGSGAQPIVQATVTMTSGGMLGVSTGANDWRVRNIQFDPNGNVANMSTLSNAVKQILFENLTTSGAMNGIVSNVPPANGIIDQLFVVNMTAQNSVCGVVSGQILYIDGMSNSAFMGNDFENSMSPTLACQEVFRIQRHNKVFISHNYLARALSSKGVLLIHGDAATSTVVGQDVVSDNVLVADSNQSQPFVIDPESGTYNEPIQNVIYERNYMVGPGKVFDWINIIAQLVTFRLNIFNQPAMIPNNGSNGLVTTLSGGATTQVPGNNFYYNNTEYATGTATSNHFDVVNFFVSGLGANTVENMLAYIPNDGAPTVVKNPTNATPCTGCTGASNSSNTQAKSTPNFTNASGTLTVPADFTPNTGSYAIAAGANVPVYYDFFRTPWVNGSYDMGAVHH